jgi:hypothetical protein
VLLLPAQATAFFKAPSSQLWLQVSASSSVLQQGDQAPAAAQQAAASGARVVCVQPAQHISAEELDDVWQRQGPRILICGQVSRLLHASFA